MNKDNMNKDKKKKNKQESPELVQSFRLRLPRGKEVLGRVIGLVGGSRMVVLCKDGKERTCRVPGRLKNQIWIKDGDVVIVQPWEIEADKHGDIIWRYSPLQAKLLREKGHINA